MRTVLATLLTALMLSGPVAAQDLTEDEHAGLTQRVSAFNAALLAADTPEILGVTPPRIYEHIAGQAGIPVPQLREMLVQQTERVMADVIFEWAEMSMDAATYHQTPDGLGYALVPTRVIMASQGTRFVAVSDTLAFQDEGKWWLLRVSEAPQVEILRQVYPSFAEVAFAPGKMTPLE